MDDLDGPRAGEHLLEEFRAYVSLERRQSPRTAIEYVRDVELFAAHVAGVLPQDPSGLLDRRPRTKRDQGKLVRGKSYWWRASVESIVLATPSDVRQFIMWLGRRDYSTVAVRRKIAALRAFYAVQRRSGRRNDDPTSELRGPKHTKTLPKQLPDRDVSKLMATVIAGGDAFERARNRAIVAVFAHAGVRRAELVALDIGDVDLEQRTLRITGKGNKQRIVFITPEACAALDAYLVLRGTQNDDEAVFLGRRLRAGQRQRISHGYVGQLIAAIGRVSGIGKRVRPHMLRHWLATHLLENGADLVHIRDILGHESVATTQIYTHVARRSLQASYDRAMTPDE